jgi:putative FmdB family regulatory protein
MPVYDYMCDACGPFTQTRPMSEYNHPQDCPECAASSPRAILSAPRLATMDSGRRTALSTNERSANAPMNVSQFAAAQASTKHGAGCGCCSGKMKSRTRTAQNGAKSFPSARPWMISH